MNASTGKSQPLAASHPSHSAAVVPTPRRKWYLLGLLATGALLVGLVIATPWLISSTQLRNRLLAWLLPPEKVSVSSQAAELGWTQPMEVQGVEIRLPQEDLQLEIERVAAQQPWWQILRSAPHFGSLRLERPVVEVSVERLMRPRQVRPDRRIPALTLHAQIRDADVRLLAHDLPHPVLELKRVSAEVDVLQIEGQSVLRVGRSQILDHYPLTPEFCNRGLQLVAPILARVSRIEGSASLDFDALQLPLGGNDHLTNIRGRLQLHEVTTGLANPVLHEALNKFANLFEVEIPETLHIAQDAVIHFAVNNNRVEHDSIHFKLPALTGDRLWRSRGSVGLDESLDLELEAPVPVDAVSDSALARLLSAKPLRLHIGGTIGQPELRLPEEAGLLQQIGSALVGDPHEEDDFEKTLDRVEAALEAGEAAAPLLQWAARWLTSSADD